MKLKNKPTTSIKAIEPKKLVQYLIGKGGQASIMQILLDMGIIMEPAQICSSKRALLRKARKGWTTEDKALSIKGKNYWTYIDGKASVEVEGHSYTSGVIRLLDEATAKSEGLI